MKTIAVSIQHRKGLLLRLLGGARGQGWCACLSVGQTLSTPGMSLGTTPSKQEVGTPDLCQVLFWN